MRCNLHRESVVAFVNSIRQEQEESKTVRILATACSVLFFFIMSMLPVFVSNYDDAVGGIISSACGKDVMAVGEEGGSPAVPPFKVGLFI